MIQDYAILERICNEIYKYDQNGNVFKVGYCSRNISNLNKYLNGYDMNQKKLLNAFFALPAILMGDEKIFMIQDNTCISGKEITYAVNINFSDFAGKPHYTKCYRLDLLAATRYIIQEYEAFIDTAQNNIKAAENLKQTPKHVVRVYNREEEQEGINYKKTIVVSNRQNALLLVDSVLQFIARCVFNKEITISENCKQQLDNIYDVIKTYKGIVNVNDEEIWEKITPYIFEIYNERIPFDTAISIIEQGRLKQELQTFQRNRIQFFINEITRLKSNIENYEKTILDAYETIRKTQHTKNYLEEESNKSVDNIVKALQTNKSVKLLSIENNYASSSSGNVFQIKIKINTLLTNIDYALAEKSIIRSKNTGISHELRYASKEVTKLWYNLLMNGPKYALKVTQDFKLKIRPAGTIEAELINCNGYGESYSFTVNNKQAIPNPHLHYYKCFGTTTTVLAKYSNIDETFEQYLNTLIGCTANLNVNDTTVFKKIIDMLNELTRTYANPDAKLKLITNLETGEEFSLYEFMQTEDYKNAPDNYKEFV